MSGIGHLRKLRVVEGKHEFRTPRSHRARSGGAGTEEQQGGGCSSLVDILRRGFNQSLPASLRSQ